MIHVGDCIEWLECFGDASIDVTICDPPYSDHVHAKSVRSTHTKRRKSQPVSRDLGFAPLTPALRRDFAIEVARVTRRWVLLFCDDRNIGAWRFDLEGAGLEVVRVCAWIKIGAAPQMTGDRPGSGWEAIMVAHRRNAKGTPAAKHWNGGGKQGVYVHAIPRASGGRTFSTEKPVSLMLELVEHFSDRGELVADPFAGSGTTGVACVRLGRLFVGAELDPLVARLADKRLLAEREGHPVAAHDAGQRTIWEEISNGRAPNGDVGIMKT